MGHCPNGTAKKHVELHLWFLISTLGSILFQILFKPEGLTRDAEVRNLNKSKFLTAKCYFYELLLIIIFIFDSYFEYIQYILLVQLCHALIFKI